MLVKPLITDLYRQIVPHRYPDNCAAAVLLKPVIPLARPLRDLLCRPLPSLYNGIIVAIVQPLGLAPIRPAARAVAVSFHEVSSARIR